MNYCSLYLLVLFFFSIKCIPTFPTFAILSVPIIERVSEDKFKSTKERIDNTFVRWLQSSGADVIPINTFTPESQVDLILQKVNGIIFPSNDQPISSTSSYFKQAKYIYSKVIEMYNESKGEIKVPLLFIGNDLGLLCKFVDEDHDFIVQSSQIWGNELHFNNITNAKKTFIFSEFDNRDIRAMEFFPMLPHDIQYMVANSDFLSTPSLKKAFTVLAVTRGLSGIRYVAALQSKEFPIIGIAFNPSLIAFEQSGKPETDPHYLAVKVARYMGNSLVQFAMKNNRTMTLEDKLKLNYIDPYKNYPEVINGKYQHLYKRTK